jgi:hypothetical protein
MGSLFPRQDDGNLSSADGNEPRQDDGNLSSADGTTMKRYKGALTALRALDQGIKKENGRFKGKSTYKGMIFIEIIRYIANERVVCLSIYNSVFPDP